MNVLLTQFVITRAIRGCLRTLCLLVKHRHTGPAVMYEPSRQKALVILREKMRKAARLQLMLNKIVDSN